MKGKVIQWIEKNKNRAFIIAYAVVGVIAAVGYPRAKEIMISQDAWLWVIKSNVTFNFILFLFIWGVAADKYTKHLSKKVAWTIWGMGFIVIVILFRLVGGMETIFG